MFVKTFTPFVLGALLLPMLAVAQTDTGTANYGGTIPTTRKISNSSDGPLADASELQFGNLSITTADRLITKSLTFRLRSNDIYVLSASATVSGDGIVDNATTTAASTTAKTLSTSDIAFGLSSTIDASGGSVVGGRTDTIAPAYNLTVKAPTASNGRMVIASGGKTLHDIVGSAQPILSGPRISASGDNYSNDNFIGVTVQLATMPQYLTAGSFSGVIQFTLGAS